MIPPLAMHRLSGTFTAFCLSLPPDTAHVVKKSKHTGLKAFLTRLETEGELLTISAPADPVLEITEITDRITKSGGKAILFKNTGTDFPLLINMFGSERRMAMAIGRTNLDEAGRELEMLMASVGGDSARKPLSKPGRLSRLLRYAGLMPVKRKGRGICQQIVMEDPDLNRLPVMKCWPYDGGRFITLPAVHTFHPETGHRNTGMYRMQVFDSTTTGMHWHRHKTGARHYEAWKKKGGRMPVAVTLGGDPVYIYAATAPLPENIDEYILAGFLRGRRVELVRCLTQDIWVPHDADMVIEGYIDTGEDHRREGPFGDHTGVYSLADDFPVFHVTAITHSCTAVYPSTIVGVPPQEDAWIGMATERLFLTPIRLALSTEVVDIHMPPAGNAHNLVIVKIDKKYPGQGMKVLNTLFGAGQMMFSKYIVVTDGSADIRNPASVLSGVEKNCSFQRDLMLLRGPLDILDHAADNYSFGGKMGIDATVKYPEEKEEPELLPFSSVEELKALGEGIISVSGHSVAGFSVPARGVLIIAARRNRTSSETEELKKHLLSLRTDDSRSVMVILEEGTDLDDPDMVLWQATGNSDPVRDIVVSGNIIIDAGFKLPVRDKFRREWPNVVVSDRETIGKIDGKWEIMTGLDFIASPSGRLEGLVRGNGPCAD